MKIRNLLSMVLLGILIAAQSITAPAQSSMELLFKANVPFDFVAGGVHLPAGRYSVYRAASLKVILIRSESGKGGAFMTVTVANSDPGKSPNVLVFSRYGNRYFLSQVTTQVDHQVHNCSKCREEQALITQRQQSETKTAVGY